MDPNYCQITILLVVDLCSSLAYFMMTHPLPIAGKLPIKTLVAGQLPINIHVAGLGYNIYESYINIITKVMNRTNSCTHSTHACSSTLSLSLFINSWHESAVVDLSNYFYPCNHILSHMPSISLQEGYLNSFLLAR